MATRLAFLVTVCAALVLATSSYAQVNWNDVRMASQDAIAYIETQSSNLKGDDPRVVSGTGFLITSSGYVITASHVVPEPEAGRKVEYRAALRSPSEQKHRLQLICRMKEHDVALLKFVDAPPAPAGLRMKLRGLTEEDARLYTLGFPARMVAQTGSISSAEGMLSNMHGPGGLWQTTLPLNRGNSGGPVFDQSGQVVAVAVGGFDDAHLITFVRPAYQLVGLMQQLPVAVDVRTAPEVQVVRSSHLDDEIEKYVSDVWLRDQEVYAAVVDYFKYGVVDRTFIAKEKSEYAERWPSRRYSLMLGTLRATKIGEGTVVTTFRFSYKVSNSTRSLSGEGAAEVTLQIARSGGYEVRSAKEILFR